MSRGLASPEDVDTAVSTGPGLRWALAGPYMTNVLGGGGGKDGFDHFMKHLGPAVRGWKEDMDENKFSFEMDETKHLQAQVTPWLEKKEPEIEKALETPPVFLRRSNSNYSFRSVITANSKNSTSLSGTLLKKWLEPRLQASATHLQLAV